jgi:DNA-3-methyladenine glycosylase
LVRALEPREGVEVMGKRRKTPNLKNLCSGPGKLCGAMNITREHYGADLCLCGVTKGEALFITEGEPVPEDRITATPRINVDYAGEAALLKYRFVVCGSPFLSVKP